VRVVECGCQADKGDDCGQLVQDEERGYVAEGCGGERGGVFVEEFGEAAVEAVDSRGRTWGWCWLGCEAAGPKVFVFWYAALRSAEECAVKHRGDANWVFIRFVVEDM